MVGSGAGAVAAPTDVGQVLRELGVELDESELEALLGEVQGNAVPVEAVVRDVARCGARFPGPLSHSASPPPPPMRCCRGRFLKMPMPEAVYDRMMAFYKKFEPKRISENWSPDATHTNFHDAPMTLVYLDNDMYERDRIANTLLKPHRRLDRDPGALPEAQ